MSGKNSKISGSIQTKLRSSVRTASASPSRNESVATLPSLREPTASASPSGPDLATLRFELLALLRKDIADIFKKEFQEHQKHQEKQKENLQKTLRDALSTTQLDLQVMKTQLASDKVATDATISTLKGTFGEMEHALSGYTVHMKTTIESLTATVTPLENKCEDLESRSRRNNVPEGPDTCTTAAVKLLKPGVAGNLEPIPGSIGHKAEYTLDRVPVHRRALFSSCILF
ncbi:hypothetical protein AMELA_G00003160 [Ameiurus melas]|uniref:Uncharacterized protein n=1 Tax=Ameiurus melas TaxID=219545 RepID=A0A7J6BEK9_AMEME|nr:hypothetical protein AMELA_G00003160 [Ameiurus melas]